MSTSKNKQQEVKLIKNLIKRAITIVGNKGSKVTLETPDDCGLFVSNLFGYKNWKDVRNVFQVENVKNKPISDAVFLQRNLNLVGKEIKIVDLTTPTPKGGLSFEKTINPEHRKTLSFIHFANHENSYLGSFEPMNFQPLPTLIIKDLEDATIMDKIENNLKMYSNSYIKFSGEATVSLDPWVTMIKGGTLEGFLNTEGDLFANGFIQLLKALASKGVMFPLNNLVNLLEIENSGTFFQLIKREDVKFSKLLEGVYPSVFTNLNSGFEITETFAEKYTEVVQNVYARLNGLKRLYDLGVFKKMFGEDVLVNELEKRNNIVISDKYCDEPFYQEVVQLEVDRAFDVYEKHVGYALHKYDYWFLMGDAHTWSKMSFKKVFKNRLLIPFIHTSAYDERLNDLILNSQQILFGKSNNIKLNSEVKEELLNSVLNWPEHFWHKNNAILGTLRNKEWYYIFPKEAEKDEVFRVNYCKLVSLEE